MRGVSPGSAAWGSPGLALWLSAEPIAASHEAGSSHEPMAVTFVERKVKNGPNLFSTVVFKPKANSDSVKHFQSTMHNFQPNFGKFSEVD